MILQALYDYARRKGGDIPEDGFANVEIKHLIKITEDGAFIDFVSTVEDKKGKIYTHLPKQVERTSGAKASLLLDNAGYVLGVPKQIPESDPQKDKKQAKEEKSARVKNELFIGKIEELYEKCSGNTGVAAVHKFYTENRKNGFDAVSASSLWEEVQKSTGMLSFILEHEDALVAQHDDVAAYHRNALAEAESAGGKESGSDKAGICLITGEKSAIARLHPATPILNSKSVAKLVGFQVNSGYDSYGKEQSHNAPVSVKAAAAYTNALNYLKDSPKNRFFIGSDTVVFWAEKGGKANEFEGAFASFFNPPRDNPDKGVAQVKSLLSAAYTGKLEEIDSNFYVLCLSPNAARISVRFWETGTVRDFASRIRQHFDDFEIVRAPYDPECLNLYHILSSVALERKIENVAPNLIGAIMQSILRGLPYPATLQQQCIRRIRAEQKVTRERAAILKAYLNRLYRYNNSSKEVLVSLDRKCSDKGYLLGRLFAVLEKVQQDTHPGLNATITDQFYGSASTNPATVFTQLLKLNQHHLSNYESKGLKTIREKELGEIMNAIDHFPTHLNMNEQSQFAIGYYHEKQSFFEKTNTSDKSEGENGL
ncbi:MAG: type I-C CRISPR-associated protein Cas8c/Csd1 [Treponemataceae bacterium]|nr:type I-C CRISPR-associated protein Cas8c/Csd1 [Treponemataceae bacterium]